MGEILTVINDRNKVNLTCLDGTVLEMAFDTLQGRDANGRVYPVKSEIEFETISGEPENLAIVYKVLNNEFPGQIQKNTLSKYARTKKELREQKIELSTDELAACSIFAQILNSNQFFKLKTKGQMLHRYDIPTLTNLDNFKDFEYLVERVAEIKSGDYKIPVSRRIADKKEFASLLKNGNYEIKDSLDLEDMFCMILSDVSYKVAEEEIVEFLDKNYFQDDKVETNRLIHSQQVMLGTGLICKNLQVEADLNQKLTAMVAGLSHDIGHVPFAHIMEEKLKESIGTFSHDYNGSIVIDEIFSKDYETIYNNVKEYYVRKGNSNPKQQEIVEAIEEQKNLIKMAIKEHSRTNSEQRGEGIVVQGPRESDKIQYVASDIRDLQRYCKVNGLEPAEFFTEEFVNKTLKEICAKKQADEYNEVKNKIYSLFIEPIKNGEYGRAVVNVIGTVKNSRYDSQEYYDVDSDIWNFIAKTIKRTAVIRGEKGIDDVRPEIKDFSGYIATEKLVKKYLEENHGDRKIARKKGLHDITNMGELDAFALAKEKIGIPQEQIERLKNGDYSQLLPQDLETIRKRTFELLANVLVQTGHGTKKELYELSEEVNSYGVEELIKTYLNAPVTTKVDTKKLEEFNVEDVQLKIIPSETVTIHSILRAIGVGETEYQEGAFDDLYFKSNLPNATLSVRKSKNNIRIRVKEMVPKKVSEIIRNIYEVEGNEQDSVLELVRKLNAKYPGLNVEIVGSVLPYRSVSVKRSQYTFESKNGKEIEVREDNGILRDAKRGTKEHMHQIEIQADPKEISKIKVKLREKFGKDIFSQDTKEGRNKKQKTKWR